MNALTLKRTLLYYDGPQIIEAIDDFGVVYICFLQEDSDFIAVPCEFSLVASILENKNLDCSELLANKEKTCLFFGLGKELKVNPFKERKLKDINEELLPDSDFILEMTEDLEIHAEAVKKQKALFWLGIENKESFKVPQIAADKLQRVLKSISALVEASYTSVPPKVKGAFGKLVPSDEILSVYGFSHGSFKVKFEINSICDSAGESIFPYIMSNVDKLVSSFENNIDSDALSDSSKRLRVQILNLSKFISESNIPLYFEWAEPSLNSGRRTELGISKALEITKYFTEFPEDEGDEIELIGELKMADKSNNLWKLEVDDNEKSKFSGGVYKDSDCTIDGLKIGKSYLFNCIKTIEQNTLENNEKNKYHLISWKEAY
jgi:hypothetical protein